MEFKYDEASDTATIIGVSEILKKQTLAVCPLPNGDYLEVVRLPARPAVDQPKQ